jgi:hypothetical protein
MTPHDPEKLERLIHQTLRSLPDRRAPHTLEGRVMAALATRTALPWWRQSFTSWPGAVRAGFLVLSIAAAAGLVLLGMSGSGGLSTAAPLMARLFAPVAELRAVATSLGDFCAVMIHAIPSLWLYGGLALVAVLYTALFGLSAAAYRTLYVQH